MAVRTITTKMAIDGQSEYNAKIAAINSQLKTHQSQLKLVESEYRNNANSMAALQAKAKALSDVYDTQKRKIDTLKDALSNAVKAQADHTQKASAAREKIAALEKELRALSNSTEDTSEEQARLTDALEKARAELQYEEAAVTAAGKGINDWTQKVNKAEIELNDLNDELRKNDKYLDEAKVSADGCATSIDKFGKETKEAKAETRGLGSEAQSMGGRMEKAFNAVGISLSAAGILAGIRAISKALTDCTKSSIEFESALAGVFKTVDGTDEQLATITNGIREMALRIPSTTTEIAAVAEAAGQLGIATDDILTFTEVMINLGVSTNLTADEAATSLAKFANITGLAADEYGALGSAIVALGNNTATTERDIVAMAMNLASAGKQAGLTNAEIMGVAATLSSVGLEAQAGGTAFSKAIIEMKVAAETGSDALEKYGEVAGLSAYEFQKLFNEDAISAIKLFFTGLGNGSQSAIAILKEMDITETRLRDTMLRLSSSGDLLTNSVNLATNAMAENTALTEEASKRYETTESKVALFKNSVTGLKTAIGDSLNPALQGLLDIGTDVVEWATEYTESSRGLFWQLEETRFSVEKLAASANNVAPAFETAQQAYDDTVAASDNTADAALRLIDRLSQLESQTALTKDEEIERRAIMETLIEMIPEVASLINVETGEIQGGTAALIVNTEAWRDNAKARAEQEYLDTKTQAYSDAVKELTVNQVELYKAERKLEAAQKAEAEFLADNREALSSYGTEYHAAASKAVHLSLEVTETQRRIDALTTAISTGEEAVEQYQQEAQETADAIAALGTSTAATTEMNTALIESNNALITRMDELTTAYLEVYKAAYESISNTCGLFNTLDSTADQSVTDLISSLQSQIDFMDTYAANMEKAMELGVDEGLVQKLSDGSVESAKILQAIVDDGGENIDELNEKLAAVEKGKVDFSDQVAAMQVDFEDKCALIEKDMDELVAEMNQAGAASENAKATMAAYIDGLNSYYDELCAAVNKINTKAAQIGGSGSTDGSHAGGLPYVPYDGYRAELHRGERVLTAAEAAAYVEQQTPVYYERTHNSSSVSTRVDLGGIHINIHGAAGGAAEARKYGEELANSINRELRYKGVLPLG